MLNCLIGVIIIVNMVIWNFGISSSIISQNYAQSNFYIAKVENKYIPNNFYQLTCRRPPKNVLLKTSS